ncbi:hypothetical protein ACLOJK_001889 [Asimina triloba]
MLQRRGCHDFSDLRPITRAYRVCVLGKLQIGSAFPGYWTIAEVLPIVAKVLPLLTVAVLHIGIWAGQNIAVGYWGANYWITSPVSSLPWLGQCGGGGCLRWRQI